MATLFNTKISATYEGLLKTIDNAAISATLKELTDGSGNQSGLYLNTAGDFKVTSILEWGSLKDTGTGVTITQFVTAANGIENFNNDTTLPTSAAVKLYVDTKFSITDTLTEVLGFGNTTSGKDIAVSAGDDITFTDTSKILMGTDNDLEIYRDGSNAWIDQVTDSSTLFLKSTVIVLRSGSDYTSNFLTGSDGAEVTLHYNGTKRFETTTDGSKVTGNLVVTGTITGSGGSFLPLAGGTMTGNTLHGDNVKSVYGTGGDLEIFHNGTKSIIKDAGAGDLQINASSFVLNNSGDTKNMIIAIDGGAVNLFFDASKKLETTTSGVAVTGNLVTTENVNVGVNATFADNGKALFGDSNDLEVSHNSSTSQNIIQSSLSRQLAIQQDNLFIANQAGTESMITAVADGAVSLYFNGSKKIETLTAGAKVTGDLEVTGTITGAGGSFLPLIGGTMTGDTLHGDNVKSLYGAGGDLEIFHSGTDSFIKDVGTGNLKIRATNLLLQNAVGANYVTCVSGGAVELSHNNVLKFETTSTGISVTGNGAFTGSVNIADSQFLNIGNNDDLTLTHNGTGSIIKNFTGALNIDQAAITQSIVFKVSNSNALDTTALIINREGDLITGADVTIAGDLTVNGTTTTVNSQTLSVEDPLISLATANAANSLDIGFYGKYNDGTTRYTGLFNDASDTNTFRLFKGTTVEPTTTVNISGAGYVAADLIVAGLEATNFVSTDITIADYIYHAGNLTTNFGFDGNNSFSINLNGDNVLDFYQTVLYLKKPVELTSSLTGTSATFAGDVIIDDGVGRITLSSVSGENRIQSTTTGFGAYEKLTFTADDYQFALGNATFAGNLTAARGFFNAGATNVVATFTSTDATSTLQCIDSGGNVEFGASGNNFVVQPAGGVAQLTVGASTSTFAGNVSLESALPLLYLNNTTASTGKNWRLSSATNGKFFISEEGVVDAITLEPTTGSATFAGNANINGTTIGTDQTYGNPYRTFAFGTNADGANRIFAANDGSDGMYLAAATGQGFNFRPNGGTSSSLVISSVGDATFAGTVKINNSGGNILDFNRGSNPLITLYENATVYGFYNNTTAQTDFSVNHSNGNVGIGTDNPGHPLEVVGAISSADTGLQKATFANVGNDLVLTSNADATNVTANIIFKSSGAGGAAVSEKMRIDSAGKVGIGTTNPSAKLDVNTTSNGYSIVSTFPSGPTIGIYNGTNSGQGIGTVNNYPMNLFTNNSAPQVTLSTAGNVGIGTTSPAHKIDVQSSGNVARFGDGTRFFRIYTDSGEVSLLADGSVPMKFYTSGSEKMRIDTSGNVGIGTDSPDFKLHVNSTDASDNVAYIHHNNAAQSSGDVLKVRSDAGDNAGSALLNVQNNSGTALYVRGDRYVGIGTTGTPNGTSIYGSAFIDGGSGLRQLFQASSTTTAVSVQRFYNPNGNVGSIQTNGSATSFNTSSDYRLKEDFLDFKGLDMVSKIPVYDFKWKTDESRSYGVIAHELQEVLPQAVSGDKDAKEMQSVDYSKIVPLLIKSIQELEAKIKILEQK